MSSTLKTAKRTLLVDKFMSVAIKVCGVGIIAAVMCLLVYISYEVAPLVQKAKIEHVKTIKLESSKIHDWGFDEWSNVPTTIDSENLIFQSAKTGDVLKTISLKDFLGLNKDEIISAADYNKSKQQFVAGSNQGRFFIIDINYSRVEKGDEWVTVFDPSIGGKFNFSGKQPISAISYGAQDEDKLVGALIQNGDQEEVKVAYLAQEVDLFGNAGDLEIEETYDIQLENKVKSILVSNQANMISLADDKGKLILFHCRGSKPEKFQEEALGDVENTLLAPVLGDMSLITVDKQGSVVGLSMYKENEKTPLLFHKTKLELEAMPAGETFRYSGSTRNKSFLLSSDKTIRLYNFTTEQSRWEYTADSNITGINISKKYDNIFILDENNNLSQYNLNDPHPESSWKTFFGKIHYEGAPEESYKWESTGGTDEAESKMSMIPLVYGTLKATFYAMLFATPLALFAALYTSQFLHPSLKKIVKPTMEIMASLPSVIIGFFGAIWLAPKVEDKFPSIIALLVLLPLMTMIFGRIQAKIPLGSKLKCANGFEFFWLIPVLVISGIVAWKLGPVFENMIFDHSFKSWWNHSLGMKYESKNAIIVGISMGFAVIPIIFTITEDALSNVPQNLISGSLALGASRWQTAVKVVLPTASAGIFSAIMIGLGRAVGETMIVLFCCGGTSIMETNPFSGMRTLSVNLATELPEAPKDGTLFRALFLGALLLFLMTFVINTIAEILRQYIRNKYKVV